MDHGGVPSLPWLWGSQTFAVLREGPKTGVAGGMQMTKFRIKRILIVAAIVAALFSFIQDFVYFDYDRSGAILTGEEQEKLDNMLYKDVQKYIDVHTKKHSVFESIKYILSWYGYPSTWQHKLKTLALYFFAVFLECLLADVNMRRRNIIRAH